MIKVTYNKHYIDGKLSGQVKTTSINCHSTTKAKQAKKLIEAANEQNPSVDAENNMWYATNVRTSVCQ